MKLSKSNKYLVDAIKEGYKITRKGEVVGPTGVTLKLMFSNDSNHPYYKFVLRGYRNVRVHRFQAYHKFGNKLFEPGIVVRHLNGDPLDNSWDNISIGTYSDNQMDIPEEIRLNSARVAAKAKRRLTDDEVKSLRKERESGLSYSQLMDKYGIAKSTVSYIVNRKTYNNV